MNILVTGAAGYIGSHACKMLDKAGYDVVAVDDLSRGNLHAMKWGRRAVGDIRNVDFLNQVFQETPIAAVMHFAAFAYVGESMRDPYEYYERNVRGTTTLLECMKKHGVKKLVFSSSCAVYGSPDLLPVCEAAPRKPESPYGETKLICEKAIEFYTKNFNFKSVILRYFNVVGSDPECELGEEHEPETHILPLLIDAALSEADFQIYGSNYDTRDGTCIRDYLHVLDLIDAHIIALRELEGDINFRTFNLGMGRGYTVKEVVECVEKVVGKKVNLSMHEPRDGDATALWADASKAFEELGWAPSYCSLETAVSHRLAWLNNKGAASQRP